MKAIQEQHRYCKHCKETTKQSRNVSRTSLLGFLAHGIMVIVTGGLWLIPVVLILICQSMGGKWICSACK